jgi:hypothetical protein
MLSEENYETLQRPPLGHCLLYRFWPVVAICVPCLPPRCAQAMPLPQTLPKTLQPNLNLPALSPSSCAQAAGLAALHGLRRVDPSGLHAPLHAPCSRSASAEAPLCSAHDALRLRRRCDAATDALVTAPTLPTTVLQAPVTVTVGPSNVSLHVRSQPAPRAAGCASPLRP